MGGGRNNSGYFLEQLSKVSVERKIEERKSTVSITSMNKLLRTVVLAELVQ